LVLVRKNRKMEAASRIRVRDSFFIIQLFNYLSTFFEILFFFPFFFSFSVFISFSCSWFCKYSLYLRVSFWWRITLASWFTQHNRRCAISRNYFLYSLFSANISECLWTNRWSGPSKQPTLVRYTLHNFIKIEKSHTTGTMLKTYFNSAQMQGLSATRLDPIIFMVSTKPNLRKCDQKNS
jgi:hypothetical protein